MPQMVKFFPRELKSKSKQTPKFSPLEFGDPRQLSEGICPLGYGQVFPFRPVTFSESLCLLFADFHSRKGVLTDVNKQNAVGYNVKGKHKMLLCVHY